MTLKLDRKMVRKVLIDRDMTARDLARVTGLGEATVYNILGGSNFNVDTLGKLAQALEMAPGDMLVTVPEKETA